MGSFLTTLLIDGSTSFIGCKIVKSLGQKEISEIVAASGYAVIGLSLLEPISWTVGKIVDLCNNIGVAFSGMKAFIDAVKSFIPGI